jgi:hypothetical protein
VLRSNSLGLVSGRSTVLSLLAAGKVSPAFVSAHLAREIPEFCRTTMWREWGTADAVINVLIRRKAAFSG